MQRIDQLVAGTMLLAACFLAYASDEQPVSISTQNCWVTAAENFNLPPMLLAAVASVESSHNPNAVAHANNGTHSVGLMQVNSSWFEQLADFGITEQSLFEPCTNIRVGAWILAQEVARYGYNWQALGAYYAGPFSEESRAWKLPLYREYAEKVIRRWSELTKRLAKTSAVTAVTFSRSQ